MGSVVCCCDTGSGVEEDLVVEDPGNGEAERVGGVCELQGALLGQDVTFFGDRVVAGDE